MNKSLLKNNSPYFCVANRTLNYTLNSCYYDYTNPSVRGFIEQYDYCNCLNLGEIDKLKEDSKSEMNAVSCSSRSKGDRDLT